MYYLLFKYETLFDDRKVVILYGIGMVFGTITAVIWALFRFSVSQALDLGIIFFGLLVPLFTESGKMMILGHKRLRLNFDTTFYGGALGAGIGGMMIVARAYSNFNLYPELARDPVVISTLLVLSFAFCSIHSATGIMIGFGSSRGIFWPFLARAIILQMIF